MDRVALQRLAVHVWFPVVFAVGLAAAYIGAFHHPRPHDLPVEVVGPNVATAPLVRQLDATLGDQLDVRTATTPAQAADDVRARRVTAAYVPSAPPRLIVASAASPSAASAGEIVFRRVARQQGGSLMVSDLVPVARDDYRGTSPFYLMIAVSIAGYMTAIVVSAVTTTLVARGVVVRHRVRLGVTLATTLAGAALCALVAGPIYGALDGPYLQITALCWLYAMAVALIGLGLHEYIGRATTAVLVFLFVVLNIPSAGGAYDAHLTPPFFAALNEVWPGAALVSALREVVYFGGDAVGGEIGVIAAWGLAGGLLLAASLVVHPRRSPRGFEEELEIAEGAVSG